MEPAGVIAGARGADVQITNSANLRDHLRFDVDRDNSAILLDFLRIKQEEYCINDIVGGGRNNNNRLTLEGLLRLTNNSISNGIIRDASSGSGGGGSTRDIKTHWRDIIKRLKLGGGSSWISSMLVPAPLITRDPHAPLIDCELSRSRIEHNSLQTMTSTQVMCDTIHVPVPAVPINQNNHRLSLSELLQRNDNQGVDRGSSRLYNSVENVEEEAEGESSGGVGGAVRMSLMALLAETDSAYIINDNGLGEGEVGTGEDDVEKLLDYNACCCVCMVRHKGAAFIPCGHTFCRLCSRELFVQRGNCPLCNHLIMEVLDIF